MVAALFGDANRWGRSIFTHYPAAYEGKVALNDFGMTPTSNNPGRTYRYYNGAAGPATVTVGQGLSYNALRVACAGSGAGTGTLAVACNVTSVSGPDGDQVLQVFHRASPAVIARVAGAHPVPLLTMRDVARFALPAGATVGVAFSLPEGPSLALVNATGARNALAGDHFIDVWDGGANNVTLTFTLAADSVVAVPPVP